MLLKLIKIPTICQKKEYKIILLLIDFRLTDGLRKSPTVLLIIGPSPRIKPTTLTKKKKPNFLSEKIRKAQY